MDRFLFDTAQKALWCIVLTAIVFESGRAFAHEGESHDPPAMAPAPTSASTRRSFSGTGEALELTLIYDTTTVLSGTPVPLRLLLTDKFTNEPFDGAQLELTLSGGEADSNLAATPSGVPGEYTTTANLANGKSYSLLADVTKGSVNDFFSVDGIALPESVKIDRAVEEARAKNLFQIFLPGIGLAAGAAFIGFLAGRASRHEQKAGAK